MECRNLATNHVQNMSVRDSLVNARLEKLDGSEYIYDFSQAVEYPLEEYIMTYADLVSE